MTRRKIAYVTGTRADFGLMTSILRAIVASPALELSVYATGMHLMPEFGSTIQEVEREFPDTVRLPVLFRNDTRSAAAAFVADLQVALVKQFEAHRPDVILVLGDRPEMICAALVGVYLGIPVAHVHGGDKTSTVDEIARHAITKLAHIHFPATQESADRILKLGEELNRVHVVGAPALDRILHEPLPTREELYRTLQLDPAAHFLLVTQHPVSEQESEAGQQMTETLEAAKSFNMPVVVIYPNADPGGKQMIDVIERERENPLFRIFQSLPYREFLAVEREASVWIGNSSGAMVESASFHVPVVNVGRRQLGRLCGENVLHVPHDRTAIVKTIETGLHDTTFRQRLAGISNPWGDGETGPRVVRILEDLVINSDLLAKQITY